MPCKGDCPSFINKNLFSNDVYIFSLVAHIAKYNSSKRAGFPEDALCCLDRTVTQGWMPFHTSALRPKTTMWTSPWSLDRYAFHHTVQDGSLSLRIFNQLRNASAAEHKRDQQAQFNDTAFTISSADPLLSAAPVKLREKLWKRLAWNDASFGIPLQPRIARCGCNYSSNGDVRPRTTGLDRNSTGGIDQTASAGRSGRRLDVEPTITIASGVSMPLLNFGEQKDHLAAIKLGARGLDTAHMYGAGAQREVGRAVRESGVPRSSLFVTTKVPCCPARSYLRSKETSVRLQGKVVARALSGVCVKRNSPAADAEASFQALKLDYVDLLLLHWPCDHFEDTVRALKELEPLVARGKVRALGVSNLNASVLAALLPRLSVKLAVNQCGYSIAGHSSGRWGRDDETRRFCAAHGILYAAYSPLGRWINGSTSHVLHDKVVKSVAAAHDATAAQIALRWITQQQVAVVTGSDNEAHMRESLDIFDNTRFRLTPEEMAKLAAV